MRIKDEKTKRCVIKRFLDDVNKYYRYSIRAGKSKLKAEVASSHLNWLWWILDPLLFMLVYSFVSVIVFGKTEQYLVAFIFIGHTCFKFFEKTLKSSVRLVASNKAIIKNVYIPKHILMLTELYVNLFKSAISFCLVFVAMAIYRVNISWRCVFFVPLLLLLIVISEAIGMIVMHFGVYIEDLSNLITIGLRLLLYLSGVFYSIDNRIENDCLRFMMLRMNPIAFIMDQMRGCLLYNEQFYFGTFLMWLLIATLLLAFGINVVYNNENGYAKVI